MWFFQIVCCPSRLLNWWMGFLWALFSSIWGLGFLPFWEVAGLLVLGLMLTPWLEDPLAVGSVLVLASYLFRRWVFSPDLRGWFAGCVFRFPHWFVGLPVPGLWACVISGWFACLPCLWGLVVVWVAGSSKLWIIWWFCIRLMPLFL